MKTFIIFVFLVISSNAIPRSAMNVAQDLNTQILYIVNHQTNNYMGYHFRGVDLIYKSCYQGAIPYRIVDSFLSNMGGPKALHVKSTVLSARYVGSNLVFEVEIGGIAKTRFVRATAEQWGAAPTGFRIFKAEGFRC